MSTCNIDKWNMLAPTLMPLKFQKVGEDDCLTLINDLKLITKTALLWMLAAVPDDITIAFAINAAM